MPVNPTDNSGNDTRPRLKFDYLKSPQYRTVLCEGAIGGVTPQGKIFASFYNERGPIPRSTTYALAPDGALELTESEGRTAIVRELEVGVYLDLNAAESLRDWLDNLIKALKSAGKGE